MILTILFSIIGLGLIASTLHRLTLNALPFFAALSAGFAALQFGTGELEAMLIALFAGAATFGLFQGLAVERLHPVIRIAARTLYVAPACAAAWFMTLSIANWNGQTMLLGYLLSGTAALIIGTSAWHCADPSD